jgi:hypothetical protein
MITKENVIGIRREPEISLLIVLEFNSINNKNKKGKVSGTYHIYK